MQEYWFISYCSKDNHIVNALTEILKKCDIPYWKAPEMIPAGLFTTAPLLFISSIRF